eukprot:6206054-Pleurochrysis_carterae.AAC.2
MQARACRTRACARAHTRVRVRVRVRVCTCARVHVRVCVCARARVRVRVCVRVIRTCGRVTARSRVHARAAPVREHPVDVRAGARDELPRALRRRDARQEEHVALQLLRRRGGCRERREGVRDGRVMDRRVDGRVSERVGGGLVGRKGK